ncbi:hypothetical protein SOVF_212600 [Spinacia oleracea]|nr:hypothetical protein SOVF_212600 [Spinacia oleracea]
MRFAATLTQLNSIPKTALKPRISPSLSLSSSSAFPHLHFSSQASPFPKSSDVQTTNHPDADDDITTEELKRRIIRYMKEGDTEVLPSIFEAILVRKLSGKHDDADNELMEEFRSKTQQDEDDRFQSDEDLTESDKDVTESDEELTDSSEEDSD